MYGSMKTSQNTNGGQPFRKYMREKLAVTVLVIMLALFALAWVLYQLVKDRGEAYNQIVLGHQNYESRTIPFKRGSIVDRNGTYLAVSEKVYNLILDPKIMLEKDEQYEYTEATVEALVECFGYDRQELMKVLEEKKDSHYVIYAKQLAAEDKERFENYQQERNNEYRKLPAEEGGHRRIAGVWFEDEYRRVYPYKELACHVLGYALKDGTASGGVEQYYNSVLSGVNGREYGYLNDDSNLERTVKSARNGQTLELTIDANIQKICQKYIDEWQAGIGSNVAAVIVMDPNTAEILAMDTSTRYDLNDPYNLEKYYTEAEIAAMDEQTKAEAWYRMWRNFCISDSYEPGSPQKALTVAGAMEEGAIDGTETYKCEGVLHIGDWDIHCVARIAGHGPLTITQGLMKSCNVVMMRIVQREGRDKFAGYQSIFGFGARTGIDLPGEAEGLIYKAENMDPSSLATNAFGQNFNCTMIQMAAAFSSLINGGSYYEPHVVKRILDEQGAVVQKKDPQLVRETVSESTSAFIRNALYQTVSGEGGTAGAAAVEGYEVGGKTGTAEKHPRSEKNYLVSFIGFAPAYDPQVLVYVVLDTPHLEGKEQAHSTFASEFFSKIMGEILPYMNVFPDGDAAQPEDEELAAQEEGILSGLGQEEGGEENPDETEGNWDSYDEEFLDPGEDEYYYPERLPAGADTDPERTGDGYGGFPFGTAGSGGGAFGTSPGDGNAGSQTPDETGESAAEGGSGEAGTEAESESAESAPGTESGR